MLNKDVTVVGGPYNGKVYTVYGNAQVIYLVNPKEKDKVFTEADITPSLTMEQFALLIHKLPSGMYVAFWNEKDASIMPPSNSYSPNLGRGMFEATKVFLRDFLKIETRYDAYTHRHIFTFKVNLPCPTCNATGEIKVEHVTEHGEKVKEEVSECPVCYGEKELTSLINNSVVHSEMMKFFERWISNNPQHKASSSSNFHGSLSEVQNEINKMQMQYAKAGSKYFEGVLKGVDWGKKELTKEEKLKKLGIL